MNIHILFMILLLKESQAKWKLKWNDEFNNQTLDTEKWDIENESNSREGCNNCKTNSSKNLRLVDGTLAIIAIYEKHLDKRFSSGKIISKPNFTYGRFEIRAALPEGRLLKSSIYMIPINHTKWAINGQINIMRSKQNSRIASGLQHGSPAVNENHEMKRPSSNISLNDFHTYAIEWDKSKFLWFFDDDNYFSLNISRILGPAYTEHGQPFDKPFRLVIDLTVDDRQFPNQIATLEDAAGWKCSLFIIDYVRIYEWNNGTEKLNSKDDRVFRDEICSSIMPLIRPKREANIASTTILVTISMLIILLILLINLILFIRQKKLKRLNVENNFKNDYDVYDTNDCDVYNINEYYEPYEELSEYNIVGGGEATSFDKSDQKEK